MDELPFNVVYASLGFSNVPKPKSLSAGTLSSKLEAREGFTAPLLNQKSSFYYIADDAEEESIFSPRLDVESQWPIVVLEDLEAGLSDVSCTDSEIQLEFISAVAEGRFTTAIQNTPEFIIVTSHDGCDLEGERSAHRVIKVSVDPGSRLAKLSKARMDWHDAFSSTRVSFSRRHPSEIQRRGLAAVKKRQTQASTPTESFPAAPSNVDGLNSSADTSFDELHTDLEIYPLDIPLADEVVPQLPVVVRCKTCSLQGSIELSQGEFSVGRDAEDEAAGSDFELDEAIGFFKNSSIEFAVDRLSSQIELELELSSEGPLLELTTALPTIPLTPFQIAGVLTFGPQVVPNIIITADIEGDIGFSYGFSVRVPDDSRISVRIPDLGESEITGFGDTEFDTIPFEASTEVTSVALSIAFQPQILLGISTGLDFMNVNLDGGIGAFVSLPNLSLNVSQVTSVNENCDAVTGDDDIVGSAISLVPSVELDMGVIASYDVRLGAFNDSREAALVLASTSYSLPTGCVSFEPDVQPSDRAGTLASGATGDDDSDGDGGGGNSAVSAKGVSGVTLICTVILSTVAAGFCGWGWS